MQILFILNDPPYGTERCYNGLRLALALIKNEPATAVTVFLMADAVVGAIIAGDIDATLFGHAIALNTDR